MKITSARNEKVKYVQKLGRRRFRQREGRFVIEGPRLLGEAITSGAALASVFVAPELFNGDAWRGLMASLPEDVPVYEVPAAVFRQIASTDAPQGILAVAEMRRWDWEDCLGARDGPPLVVLVDGLQDPGNVGTIIRAAEALRASGVVLGAGSADPYNPKAVRATMGAVFRLPVAAEADLTAVIPQLKSRGIGVWVAAPRAERAIYDVDWRVPAAVVFGNEGAGVSPEVAGLADGFAAIPMPGRAESLNAGMAAGIVLYEALRQRSGRR